MLCEKFIIQQLVVNRAFVDTILSKLPIVISNDNGDKIRFDTYDHSSSAYSLDMNSLHYYSFREQEKGSIIDLIHKFTGGDRNKIVNELYMSIMIKGIDVNVDSSNYEMREYTLEYPEVYEEELIDEYPVKASELFREDNIGIITQYEFGVRYDYRSNRVVIPVYQDYSLVGAIGRLNKRHIDSRENKYFPILTYNKSKVLFGLDLYREKIKESKKVILVESEKSVMKAWQMGFSIPVCAVGGSSISRHHIERLNLLGVTDIIWSQDKGIEEDTVLNNNLTKLKKYSTATAIKYIDADNCELLEDKESICDKNREVIAKIFERHIKTYWRYDGGEEIKGL